MEGAAHSGWAAPTTQELKTRTEGALERVWKRRERRERRENRVLFSAFSAISAFQIEMLGMVEENPRGQRGIEDGILHAVRNDTKDRRKARYLSFPRAWRATNRLMIRRNSLFSNKHSLRCAIIRCAEGGVSANRATNFG